MLSATRLMYVVRNEAHVCCLLHGSCLLSAMRLMSVVYYMAYVWEQRNVEAVAVQQL
uniref:Uncharacterized protein n=1 Tax=Arion vulgaris TaxID=1028688 RepID=A0A0B6YNX1_9EUPU